MSHIVVLMLWEAGHLLPTLKLSRELAHRGHRVTYVTIPDLLDLPRSRGLGAVAILADYFPVGSKGRIDFWPKQQRKAAWAGIEQCARDEVIEACIESLAPDLVLVDSLFFRTHAQALRRRGLQVLLVTSSMPHEPKGGMPPLNTPLLPGGTVANRIAIRLAWCDYFLGQWWQYLLRRVPMSPPQTEVQTAEIILCAEEFDFPRPARRGRYFIGPNVDTEPGTAVEFPWHRIDRTARLIYLSFGSQAHRYPDFGNIVRASVQAIGGRAGEQLVLVADRNVVKDMMPLPDNIICVEHAPQLELLRAAEVVLTHAGLGTIKECILMGVPMIAFPQCFDQPGNAARIEFHGLGIRCTDAALDHTRLRSLLDRIDRTPSISANVRRMQQMFQRAEAQQRGVRLIERLLETRLQDQAVRLTDSTAPSAACPDSHHLAP